MKGVKLELSSEVLRADGRIKKKVFGYVWDSIDMAGYEDCLNERGNLVITVLVGEPDAEFLKDIGNA